jgi:tetratricopeptide (TPR) repeat protein/predicted Ser/Thr protein kinase
MSPAPPSNSSSDPDRPTSIPLDRLEDLAAGRAVPDAVRRAVDGDPDLAARVAALRADNDLLAEFAAAIDPAGDRAGPDGAGGGGGDDDALPPADIVPGYRIESELGRGGQGVVYRATQITARRPVALKLLARGVFAGDRQRRRLAREIEVLASLRHPGVVTVHDGGVTDDGRPWLAMELVEGIRLDAAADAFRAQTAGHPRRRDRRIARLVADVAAAVEAAHARGVMHRDLKPGNVLVDADDQPRVLDFGLAREIQPGDSSITDAGAFLGTLLYAAPEQVQGDPARIDVRADVFALGLILYESLSGERPWPTPTSLGDAVARTARPVTPLPRVAPGVDADLETIVIRCLAADPDRRYPSAGHLREDLERFLARRPIEARRDSRVYRARKLVQRRPLESATVAGLAIVLLAFAFTSQWQARRIAQRSDAYRGAAGAIVEAVASVTRDEEAGRLDHAAMLRRITDVVREGLPDDPELAIEARGALGLALLLEREHAAAALVLDEAIELARQHPEATDDAARAELLHTLGRVHYATGDFEAATDAYTQALALRRTVADSPDREAALGMTMAHLAACHRRRGDLAAAEPLYRDALAVTLHARGPDHLDTAKRRNSLGVYLTDAGRDDEAADVFRDLRDQFARAGELRTTGGATASFNLGRCLSRLGRHDEAEAALAEALAARRELDPGADRAIGRVHLELARLHHAEGRADAATADILEARRRFRAAGPPAAGELAETETLARRITATPSGS